MGEAPPPGFVRVAPGGRHLELDGSPFYFAGCNCYYLLTRAAEPGLRAEVVEVLDAAAACGLTVVRLWAFGEGEKEWNALQPRAGEFDERVFRGLDWVLAEAGKRRLRLILVLVNHWGAYGGMPQYVRWSCQRRGVEVRDDASTFYADPHCRDVFQNYIATIVARNNTETGIAYRDDPTILAWSLTNEARCSGDFSGSVLHEWAEATSEFLKSLDPHHLLALGTEGFLGASSPGMLRHNPFDCLSQGCDFVRNARLPHVDLCTAHLWPDAWLPDAGDERKLAFSRAWLDCHAACCADVGKPLVLAEFGYKSGGPQRVAFYQQVLAAAAAHMAARAPLAGACFWMTAARNYPDYDGSTIYLTPPAPAQQQQGQQQDEAGNLAVVELLRKFAADVAGLRLPAVA